MLKSLLYSALYINLGLLLGRVAGFLRDVLIASNYGASAEADVVVLVLSVPDFLVNVLVGGGLAAALVPSFSEHAATKRVLWFQSALIVGIAFSLLAVILLLKLELVVSVLAPGFSPSQVQVAELLLSIIIWLVPLTAVTGVMGAYLHAHNRFFVASLGTLVINLFIIAGFACAGDELEYLYLVMVFALLGGVARLVMQFAAGVRISGAPQTTLKHWYVSSDLITRYVQVAGAGCLLLSYPMILRAAASMLGSGQVAQLTYAQRLIDLPLLLAVTFVATVLFPRMAAAYFSDFRMFERLTVWGMRVTIFSSALVVVVVTNIPDELFGLVYGYGNMTPSLIEAGAELLKIGILGVPFIGVSTFVAVSFQAQKDARTPLLINVVAIVALLLAIIIFQTPTTAGLMWCAVFSNMLSGLLSIFVLCYRQKTLRRELFSMDYCLIMLGGILVCYSLLWLIVNSVTGEFSRVVLSLASALLSLMTAALFVPEFRGIVLRRFTSYD